MFYLKAVWWLGLDYRLFRLNWQLKNIGTEPFKLDNSPTYCGLQVPSKKAELYVVNNFLIFVLVGIEICERLSTMGIAVNLVTYLGGTMHLPSATAANIVTDFVGTSFLLCLLGGFLADSFLGRYNTIAVFASIQTLVCFYKFHPLEPV